MGDYKHPKGMEPRKPQRARSGSKLLDPLMHEIDMGSGSKAKKQYSKLRQLLRDIILLYKRQLQYEYANTLTLYMRSLRWKFPAEQDWVIELEPDEWTALSRGLRALGTPAGSSMYQWLSNRRITEYDRG